MSDYLMALPLAEWPDALTRIRDEHDVIVPLDGIPTILTKEEFAEHFRDVESPEYYAMLDFIERKIDLLGLYQSR